MQLKITKLETQITLLCYLNAMLYCIIFIVIVLLSCDHTIEFVCYAHDYRGKSKLNGGTTAEHYNIMLL